MTEEMAAHKAQEPESPDYDTAVEIVAKTIAPFFAHHGLRDEMRTLYRDIRRRQAACVLEDLGYRSLLERVATLEAERDERVMCAMTHPNALPYGAPAPHHGVMAAHTIEAGTPVVITDVDGVEHEVEALSGVEQKGHAFPLVWVNRPLTSGGFEPTPWPADSVRVASDG